MSINSTKSLTGHGLSAARMVEAIAVFLQMKEGFLHKDNNLVNPINDKINWVGDHCKVNKLEYGMSNSFGFGGINTFLIFKNKIAF